MNLWKVSVELGELEREKIAPGYMPPTSLIAIVAAVTPAEARELVQDLNLIGPSYIASYNPMLATKQIGVSTSHKAEVIIYGFKHEPTPLK